MFWLWHLKDRTGGVRLASRHFKGKLLPLKSPCLRLPPISLLLVREQRQGLLGKEVLKVELNTTAQEEEEEGLYKPTEVNSQGQLNSAGDLIVIVLFPVRGQNSG